MDYLLLTNNLSKATGKLDNLTDGSKFCFNLPLKSWDILLPSLKNGNHMFYICPNLTDFNGGDLSLLTSSSAMFHKCPLKSFKGNLISLEDGRDMFNQCPYLESFDSDLPKLSSAYSMFCACKSLKHFNCDLPSLVAQTMNFTIGMFIGCSNLLSFKGKTPLLGWGGFMFQGCNSLENFEGQLSSLYNGDRMFNGCKLNLKSVKNIAETINDLTGQSLSSNQGTITIGMSADIKDLQETSEALATIRSKGWTVTEQYN